MAPSKTYNLPGFGCSFAIIPNTDLRIRFKKAMTGIVPDPAAMGFHLAEAAYRDSEEWRQSLLEYLRGNREYALSKLQCMPGLAPTLPVPPTCFGLMPVNLKLIILIASLRKMESDFPMVQTLEHRGFYGSI